MSDPDLFEWTLAPNTLLVASVKSSGEIVGCISYKKIGPSAVEMDRLAAKPTFRGLGIGQKLIQVLQETAKNQGIRDVSKLPKLHLFVERTRRYLS